MLVKYSKCFPILNHTVMKKIIAKLMLTIDKVNLIVYQLPLAVLGVFTTNLWQNIYKCIQDKL